MNWRALAKLLGLFSCIIGFLIGISAGISFFYQEKEALWLVAAAIVPLVGGLGLMQISWELDVENVSHREATLLIVLSWIVAIFWGAFPYYLTKSFGSYSGEAFINSLFEATSGFTATAASVLMPASSSETLSHGLIFWRSLSQWLGGLGIILIALIFLPFIRSGGMELFQTSSIVRERLRTKVGEAARTILIIYLSLTLVEVIALKLGGVNLFDAFALSFSTISSGGFAPTSQNIVAYNSFYIEVVLMVFMVLGTTNFALHYSFIQKDWGAYWKSSEIRLYMAVLLIAALLIGWNLKSSGMQGNSWREAVFNTVSIGSTTGFWNTNVSLWPSFSKSVLLLLMFIGGTVGSASGAIKCFRISLLTKYAYREISRVIHPAGFIPVKFEGKVVEREVLEGVTAFFFLYILIFAVGSLIMQALGYDMMVAASGVAATLGGVGPGFNELGGTGGYFAVPILGKVTLMFCMLLGRVEIFPIMIVLSREFWRK
ncbi:MAG: TrkH family potassium uptake protein [Deltaproteobacteria bacterium]|nr:TrkH family potassium uptake protein [Deltaproteobacteria bacterium]